MFDRLNKDANAFIERREVLEYLRGIGIPSMFAGAAADEFMSKLSRDGARVSWDEFVQNGARLLPPGLKNDAGVLDPDRVKGVFATIAGRRRTRATENDVARYLEGELVDVPALFAPMVAAAMAKVIVDALDTDGDRVFTKRNLEALLDDFNREMGVA